ncbi:hypothetical protein LY76DRAFT_599678 [Colletotrichum caudatum]|nr:hypothetical protein LY76DRAFT_599678 [Colletotrichum caudatum]
MEVSMTIDTLDIGIIVTMVTMMTMTTSNPWVYPSYNGCNSPIRAQDTQSDRSITPSA